MLPSSVYSKTEVGAAELKVAHGALSGHERHLLILIDGRRTVAELAAVFGAQTVDRLLPLLESHGYVHLVEAGPLPPPRPADESDAAEEPDPSLETLPAAIKRRSGLAAGLVVLVALGAGAWVLLQRHDDRGERPKTDLLSLDFASATSRPDDGSISTVMSPAPVRRAAQDEEPQLPPPRVERAQQREQIRTGGSNAAAPPPSSQLPAVILPREIGRTSPQSLAAAQPAAAVPDRAASAGAAATAAPVTPTAGAPPVPAPEASAAIRASPPAPAGSDGGRTPRPVMVAAAADVNIAAAGGPVPAASSKPPGAPGGADAAAPAAGIAPSAGGPAERAPPAETTAAKPDAKVAMIDPLRSDAATSGLHVRDRVVPPLPARARRAGVDGGTVVARLHVTPEGRVERVDLVSAKPAQVYDESVRLALLKWVFDPPGRSAEMTVELDFRPP